MEWVIVGRFAMDFRGVKLENATEKEVEKLIKRYEVKLIENPYVGAFTLESKGRFPANLLKDLRQSMIFQLSLIYPEKRL
ncbi:MAG: hypothetical protein MPI93_04060 [Nitrosopumilus sp.]|nr:hypothetical protein [Nitrosopumilus sp.]